MKKTINRIFEFDAEDVRIAVLEFMRARDYPVPENNGIASDFSLTDAGVVLEWTEIEKFPK
jgi:hypothetical protein